MHDPLSQEVIYALKGNIALPANYPGGATAAATLAAARLNDAFANPLKLSTQTDVTATVNSNIFKVANP